MFTFLYDKFTQDNMYQMLSQSVTFVDCISKNILVCFFSVHSVVLLLLVLWLLEMH